jgi:hypothetical protein
MKEKRPSVTTYRDGVMTLQVTTIYSTWKILNKFYPDGTVGAVMKVEMNIINNSIRLLQLGFTEKQIINLYLKSYEEI